MLSPAVSEGDVVRTTCPGRAGRSAPCWPLAVGISDCGRRTAAEAPLIFYESMLKCVSAMILSGCGLGLLITTMGPISEILFVGRVPIQAKSDLPGALFGSVGNVALQFPSLPQTVDDPVTLSFLNPRSGHLCQPVQ